MSWGLSPARKIFPELQLRILPASLKKDLSREGKRGLFGKPPALHEWLHDRKHRYLHYANTCDCMSQELARYGTPWNVHFIILHAKILSDSYGAALYLVARFAPTNFAGGCTGGCTREHRSLSWKVRSATDRTIRTIRTIWTIRTIRTSRTIRMLSK